MPIAVVVIGAGPIGLQIASEVRARDDLELTGVVDIDPKKIGQDAGALFGEPPWGVAVRSSVDGIRARVAILCTASSVQACLPSVLDVIERGMAVVSTCEELVYPFSKAPAVAAQIDDAARRGGVAVLGTGVNPGFLMDALPLFMTAVVPHVAHLRVERIQDAGPRRRPFQDKVGVGLTQAEFASRAKEPSFGHRGLRESADLLARGLGLQFDEVVEEMRPLIAEAEISSWSRLVSAGMVRGIEQVARGRIDGHDVVTLYFRAALGEAHPHDRVQISGPSPLEVEVKGIHGDVATRSIAVNAVARIVEARPGLRTMLDVGVVSARLRPPA